MPGSCDSEESSPSLVSSLRRYRFQNKAKPQLDTPAQSSSNNTPRPPLARGIDRPIPEKKSTRPAPTSGTYNPLSYRKYDNSNDSVSVLKNISGKIQATFKNNSANSVLDLILTFEETKLLKDTVLQQPSISLKWSNNVTEYPVKDSNGNLLKIKRTYIYELSKYVADELNNKFAKNNSGQQLSSNPPTRTYSRVKPSEISINQTPINNSCEGQTQVAMDDYEEFCEKEQCLRKMLDAYPGADIMEAQDILVKCQWDLKKAMLEARNQPLRTTRKRGFPGSFAPQPGAPANVENQQLVGNNEQASSDPGKEPEEIVLDSSDEEEMNGRRFCPSSTSVPQAKRARRLISTDSSGDEAAAVEKMSVGASHVKSPASVPPVQQKPITMHPVQQKVHVQTTQKPATVQPAAQQKLSASVQPVHQKTSASVSVRGPTMTSVNQNNSSSDKPINVPQSLSIKPVPVSTPAASAPSEKTSSPMPSLPKGLVITQVGGVDNTQKKTEKEGMSVNGNHSVNIPSNVNKSAQLVRIKPTNNVSVSSNSTSQSSSLSVTPTNVVNTSGNKTINIPMGKGMSITSVSQSASVPKSTHKSLSITPVGGTTSKEKPDPSSGEEDSSFDVRSKPNSQRHIIESDDKEFSETEQSDTMDSDKKRSKKSHKSNKKLIPGKRKRLVSDDEDDEEYGNADIYDSEDSDCEENLTSAHCAVLKFFQEASPDELGTIPGCSKKKIEAIISYRPFTKWIDLVEKLRNDKTLSTDLLNGAKKVLDMRNAITKLMTKCQQISSNMEVLVESLKENKETSSDYVSKQPELLNERMHLTGYQMLGLNWLILMHNQKVNAILADEMGLGKTVQAISFLAYLKQIEEEGPNLIVVPSSTLDNWRKELETWWPSVSLICYHGSQENRRELRMQILNDEIGEFDVLITTYNMVTSSAEDRNFFKRLDFNYVVFDEAHMLKNMASQRYTNLMRIKAPRRLLLTGTPLQNNLVELMSLLIFAMPNIFSGKIESIKSMFSCVSKATGNKNTYEKDRIEHAKRIMKPFVLRRLKKDVLKELPNKHEETRLCPMVKDQAEKYEELIKKFSAEVESAEERDQSSSGAGMMMQLRRAANHPLLLRRFFDDDKLLTMSQLMLKEPTHDQSDPNIIFEDMAVMSDFELHKLCSQYKSLKSFVLANDIILNSGKFKVLDELLPDLIKGDHRILLFSQFTMVLDIVQEYMNIKKYKFLRLDGQVPVPERQQLIDDFNNDPEILVFLLSTRAGGLGINLTAADTVILHDIDFNPYNDKQAEDRCHRVGQVRDVKVIRLISESTIEEGILQRAKEKLKLERDIHNEDDSNLIPEHLKKFSFKTGKPQGSGEVQQLKSPDLQIGDLVWAKMKGYRPWPGEVIEPPDNEENDTASVAMLLRDALGLKPTKS